MEVVVNYTDARAYAGANSEKCEDQDELIGPMPTTYMIGDLFNNDRTDTSKLQVRVENLRRSTRSEDRDDTGLGSDDIDDLAVNSTTGRVKRSTVTFAGRVNRDLGDRLEYMDSDETPVFYSEDGYPQLVGDLTTTDRSEETPLTLRQILGRPQGASTRATHSNAPAYDLDDFRIIGSKDSIIVADKDVKLLSRTETILPSDVNEQQVYLEGRRYVQRDADDVPVYYSQDVAGNMQGDLYSNQRTDATPLRTVLQPRVNPITWFRPQTTVIIEGSTPPQPPNRTIQVQEQDFHIDEKQDFDDMHVEVTLGDTISTDDALPLYASSGIEEYMVGDLFPNKRTDNEKLQILRLTPSSIQAGITGNEKNTTDERSVKRDFDLDEVDSIYINGTNVVVDPDEMVLTPRYDGDMDDAEELSFTSPSGYMTGDMFDNSRSDTSQLTARVERPSQPPVPPFKSIDIYRIGDDSNPTSSAITTTTDSDNTQLFHRIEENSVYRQTMTEEELQQGIRLAMVDMDDVPVLFSSDSRPYIGGDMFANDRSDTSKLRVVLKSATLSSLLRWRNVEDEDDLPDSRTVTNPGFLE